MTTKDLAGPRLGSARSHGPDLNARRPGLASLATGMLLTLFVVGAAFGQDANRLELCSLDSGTVGELQADVAAGTDIDDDDIEIAFVVVYSLNNDNNGQPLDGGATGPVLCTNPALVDPTETFADEEIPLEGTIDILDSAEAFLLRYQDGETASRFCHTTNANVDCFLLEPPSD
jgi:hypothetical protein